MSGEDQEFAGIEYRMPDGSMELWDGEKWSKRVVPESTQDERNNQELSGDVDKQASSGDSPVKNSKLVVLGHLYTYGLVGGVLLLLVGGIMMMVEESEGLLLLTFAGGLVGFGLSMWITWLAVGAVVEAIEKKSQ